MELMIFITNHFLVFSKIFTPPKNSRIAPEKGHNFEKGEISSEPVPSIFRGNFRRRPLKPKDLENQPDAQMQIFFRWTLVVLKCMGSNHYEPKRQIINWKQTYIKDSKNHQPLQDFCLVKLQVLCIRVVP